MDSRWTDRRETEWYADISEGLRARAELGRRYADVPAEVCARILAESGGELGPDMGPDRLRQRAKAAFTDCVRAFAPASSPDFRGFALRCVAGALSTQVQSPAARETAADLAGDEGRPVGDLDAEEQALCAAVACANQARDELVQTCIDTGLVARAVSQAHRWWWERSRDELEGIALAALQEASLRFDPEKGGFFSYAQVCLKSELGRRVWQGLSDREDRDVRAIGKAHDRLMADLGRDPTAAEIAATTDLREERVEELLPLVGFCLDSLDEPEAEDGVEPQAGGPGPLVKAVMQAFSDQIKDCLREMLATGGVHERRAREIVLYWWGDRTLAQIAATLELRLPTIQSDLCPPNMRALYDVRKCLRRHGWDPSNSQDGG